MGTQAACRAVLFASLVTDPDDDPMYGLDEEIAGLERAKLIEELVKWENSNNPDVINRARQEIARSMAAEMVADGKLKNDTPLVADALKLTDEETEYLPVDPTEYTPHQLKHKLAKPAQVNHFLVHYAPPVLDPFAGGGSIPLEAQRLGLRAHASDLNPVPVLINKALIEIPPKYSGLPPVNPDVQKNKLDTQQWHGAQGLAEDVRYYGQWMREEAEKRIGNLYPKVKITAEMVKERPDLQQYKDQELTVIAWLWARTVASPNPACGGKHVPLIKSFWLGKKKGKEAYIQPVIDRENSSYGFEVKSGKPSDADQTKQIDEGTKIGRGCRFRCIISEEPIPEENIKDDGMNGKLGATMIAIVAEGNRGRVYLPPNSLQSNITKPTDLAGIDSPIALDKRAIWCLLYGLTSFDKLFTPRQLVALTTFSDLVRDAREQVLMAAEQNTSHMQHSDYPNRKFRPEQYADAVATYLAFGHSNQTNRSSTICGWDSSRDTIRSVFARQALPMSWDYAEANPFCSSSGNWSDNIERCVKVIRNSPIGCSAISQQKDAMTEDSYDNEIISCDPPYYDNIGYADLSDFFYVWLRKSVSSVYPELFSTLLTPKSEELIASPYRHDGNKKKAATFFEEGLGSAIGQWRNHGNTDYPTTIFYAFKQAETDKRGTSSTGWETFLTGVIDHGYAITGTWPMRTELANRSIGQGTNALASSVVLVCRPRNENAERVSRRDFRSALKDELPEALRNLQRGNIAPVDLAQAAIGPGMSVFSRYAEVLEQDGSQMTVRTALTIINELLDEVLSEQEGEFDTDTRFAIKWFEQYAHNKGPFGDANTLANALAIGINGLEEAGILVAKSGKVQLIPREELPEDWDPATDSRMTVWECAQQLIYKLEEEGETATAELLNAIVAVKESEFGDIVRDLAYRLYNTCERKGWSTEARSYNALVISWPEIVRLARDLKNQQPKPRQQEMFE